MMAFHAPLALPNIASATGEIFSAALHAPFKNILNRSPLQPSPSSSRSEPQIASRNRPRLWSKQVPDSISKTPTTPVPVATPLPDFLASTSVPSFRSRPILAQSEMTPTAMGIISLVPRNALSRCSPISRRLFPASYRQYSTSSTLGPFQLRRIPNIGQKAVQQRRSIVANNTSLNLLAHMEQTANNNPSSATAQNAFYSALLRANRPDIVVQRYESGRYATNPACETLYFRALERANGTAAAQPMQGVHTAGLQQNSNLTSEQIQAVSQAVGANVKGSHTALAKSGSGAKDNPIYVIVEESTGSSILKWVRFLLWFVFCVWSLYVFLTMLVEAGGMLRRVGGHSHAEAKPEMQKTRFSDVHGCDEAKEELQELVDFLKAPQKYNTLGGKLPKGVLLTGPPGTGKTLLARAVAGEAGVPFFYMSGSEFDEIYVGVGAKRVRELFLAARSKAPAIVFIDELDAIGSRRNERDAAYVKQTLNQLLTDLDGFDQGSGVVFLAATNFPELLDKALTRPGRFDRRVSVPLPDVRGRIAIIQHYIRNMKLGTDVDASVLARGTPGFSGAELENLANQAAVHASKRKASKISMLDFEWAKDKILLGAERRSAVIQQKDKVMTAYHEGGHALVAMFTERADPLYKATIMPRGHALGMTSQLPALDKVSIAKVEYLARMDVCMGGKVAEEMIYGPDAVTSGAASDLTQATKIAYAMVTQMGMSEKLGNVDLHTNYNRLSADTRTKIWDEVHAIVEASRARAQALLTARRKELDLLAKALVEYETLGKEEMEKIVKGEKLKDKIKANLEAPIKVPDMKVPVVTPPEPTPTPGAGLQGPDGRPLGEPSAVPGAEEPPRPYPAG